MIRPTGAKAWTKPRRLVYFSSIGGVFHFLMIVKSRQLEPLAYAAVTAGLLAYRAYVAAAARRSAIVVRFPIQ